LDFSKIDIEKLKQICCMISAFALDICVLVMLIIAYCEKRAGNRHWNELTHNMELAEKDRVYNLGCDEILIGRHASADIRLPDLSVSRYHAIMTITDGVWTITDIGSKSGTYVNGHLVTQKVLHENDVIKLGARKLVFRRRREENVS